MRWLVLLALVAGLPDLASPGDDVLARGRIGVGAGWPALWGRVFVTDRVALELKGSREPDVQVTGGRFSAYILPWRRAALYAGMEGDAITYAGPEAQARGRAAALFAGVEVFPWRRLSLQVDAGPAWMELEDGRHRVGASDVAYVVHAGVNVYLNDPLAQYVPPPVPAPSGRATVAPRLDTVLSLADEDGDGVLEGEEKAVLGVEVKNTGRGPAGRVAVRVRHEPGGRWLSYPAEHALEGVLPNSSAKLKVEMAAGRAAEDGRAVLHVEATEAGGFDPDPAEIRFATREFRAPELRVAGVALADGQEGDASGNGDGRLQPGESAELTVRLVNAGRGATRGATVKAACLDPNVILFRVNGKDPDTLVPGEVKPGQAVEVRLAVTVIKRFPGGVPLPCELDWSDARPGLGRRLELPVRVEEGARGRRVFEASPGATLVAEPAAARGPLVVAVLDFSPQEGVSTGDAVNIRDWLQAALVGAGLFRVAERTAIQRVLAEQALQQTGCTTESCAVRVGRVLNVQRVVVGTVGKFQGRYVVNVRAVEVETSRVVFGDKAMGAGIEELSGEVERLADRLGRNLR
jgi:hypothetical protein